MSNERRRRVHVTVATVFLLLSLVGGFLLFVPSMAGPPLARDPGRIGLAILAQSHPQQIWADLVIDATVEDATVFRLVVSDFLTDHSSDPLEVVIYACGQVREGLALEEINGGKILQLKPIDGSTIEWDSRLGERSECTYAVSETTTRQVSVRARSSAHLSAKSGDGVIYALPGLTTLALGEPLGEATARPLPNGSTLAVRLAEIRSDFLLTTSQPLLPASGRFAWTTSIGPSADIPSQYRITGTMARARSWMQASIFVAGALVGVAGAALLWLAESVLGVWPRRRADLTPERGESSA